MKKIVSTTLALFLTATAAQADVFLENLTWTELRDQIAQGTTTVIIPVGGTEQSGPHLALGKHNARVKFLSEKIATQLGNTLVAPVIAYVPEGNIDPPSGHMKFPGTISITDATFIQLLAQTGRSLRHAGFKNIVIIGDHGGYQKDLSIAAEQLNKEWAGKGKAAAIREYYTIAQSTYVDSLVAAGMKDSEIGSHAGLADTSLEMASAPAMVRHDKLANPASAAPENGVYGGNPTRSSAALGQKGIDQIIAGTVSAIKVFWGSSK
jgi:creatinine amidohydrolase